MDKALDMSNERRFVLTTGKTVFLEYGNALI